MVAVLLVAPLVVYPLFLMKALCFALFACAFNLLLGYVGLLSFGHALFFGWASYASAHAAKVWGLPPELAILFGAVVAAGFGLIVGAARDPPPGHLFRHDHAGAGADDVLLRRAGAVHPRRGRHPGGAARKTVRPDRPRQPDQHVFHRARDLPRLVPDDLSHHQFAVRRGAQGDPRERAARGLARLSHRSIQARRLHAVGDLCRRRRRDQGASCSSSPRSPTSTGRCRAR